MKLLVYAPFPPLRDHLAGGAQYLVHESLLRLAAQGVEVTVVCPKSAGAEPLQVAGLRVLAVLNEPEGRFLQPYERLRNLQHVADAARPADVIWSVERAFPLEVTQPVVSTVYTVCYDTEIDNLFSWSWDSLIVPSPYLLRFVDAIAGRDRWEGVAPPVTLIPDGIDTSHFSPADPTPLCARLGLEPTAPYLLFPHRPDANKGFEFAMRVLCRLKAEGHPYKLLIPKPPLSVRSAQEAEARYNRTLCGLARQLGVDGDVIFHEWVCLSDLPAYFSLGRWCLTLSYLPEGFGLTPIQSISCGTPVIATRAGALRELFPPNHGMRHVDFGAVDETASAILNAPPEAEVARGRSHVERHYGIEQMVAGYLACFRSARKRPSRYNPSLSAAPLRLSPWCHFVGEAEIWHDSVMRKYELSDEELTVLSRLAAGGDSRDLVGYELHVEKLLEDGILVGSRLAPSPEH